MFKEFGASEIANAACPLGEDAQAMPSHRQVFSTTQEGSSSDRRHRIRPVEQRPVTLAIAGHRGAQHSLSTNRMRCLSGSVFFKYTLTFQNPSDQVK